MNIFEASHALLEIELAAQEHGVGEDALFYFLMWVAEEKFPGEPFDHPLIAKLLAGMKAIAGEYLQAAEKDMERCLAPEQPLTREELRLLQKSPFKVPYAPYVPGKKP